jgi:hypothetical protein
LKGRLLDLGRAQAPLRSRTIPIVRLVVPAGNAPASSGYQPVVVAACKRLLSYRTEIGSSGAPWRRRSSFGY